MATVLGSQRNEKGNLGGFHLWAVLHCSGISSVVRWTGSRGLLRLLRPTSFGVQSLRLLVAFTSLVVRLGFCFQAFRNISLSRRRKASSRDCILTEYCRRIQIRGAHLLWCSVQSIVIVSLFLQTSGWCPTFNGVIFRVTIPPFVQLMQSKRKHFSTRRPGFQSIFLL